MNDIARYDESDFMFSEDGDLVIGERGDFLLVDKNEYIAQSSRHRIRTSDPDWFDHEVKEIGANLEDLIGMGNNPDTARLGIERITDCLTKTSLIDREDLLIKPVPLSRYVITFFVFITTPFAGEPIGFQIIFNLENGVVVRSA